MTLLYLAKDKFSDFFRRIMRWADYFSTRQYSYLVDSREKSDARESILGSDPDIALPRFCATFAFSAGRFMKRKPTKLRETSKGHLLIWRSRVASRMKIIASVVAERWWPTHTLMYKRAEHWITRRTHYAFAKQLGHRKSYLQWSPAHNLSRFYSRRFS